MIIIDIETSGLTPKKHAMISLGAVDFNTGDEFYEECKIYASDEVDPAALAVNGFTEEQIRTHHKPMARTVYKQFVKWAAGRDNVLGGQNVACFDILFLHELAGGKEEFEKVFSRRTVDLHAVAYAKLGQSLSLDGILKTLGLSPEPKPHNALIGAQLERDAFKILLAK